MRHLDDCLRLRAAAEPPLRLPSPNVAGCGGDRFDASPGASSSPAAVDSAGATPPWRQRCDSGVYSGASSPAHADELAGASPPSPPLELTTTRTREPAAATSTVIIRRRASQLPPQTPDVDASSEVWRPW